MPLGRNDVEAKVLMNFFSELLAFLRSREKPWLVPVVLGFMALGALLVLAFGIAIAPYIFAFFKELFAH